MGNFVKTALVFMGGMTAGGYCVVNAALKSKTVSTAIREGIKKKVVEDIYFETRKDAEKTLVAMAEIIEKYGYVSLADLYEIAGITWIPYAARKFFWLSVDDGKVIRGRWGYFIKLPKVIEIR